MVAADGDDPRVAQQFDRAVGIRYRRVTGADQQVNLFGGEDFERCFEAFVFRMGVADDAESAAVLPWWVRSQVRLASLA